ncbi:MAG TPA: peptidase M28, partial [Thermoanaerobaculia bacterium]|nr:peptidase M28 [Thermoanaerobaculia bacterium]
MKKTCLAVCITLLATTLIAADSPDLLMVTRIRQEGLRNSKVMEIASGITDRVGPRLTGSPNMKKANEWTRDKLTEFGLSNAHLESWGPFGRGWSSDYCSVRMLSPDAQQLIAYAMAWSPATNGALRGKVTKVKLENKADLEKNKGKLAGAIVMTSEPRELKPLDKPALDRYDEEELEKLAEYAIPAERDDARRREAMTRRQFRRELAQFAMDEKIAAVVMSG